MQWTPEFEQRGFLTRTTLGSLGIDPNLDEKSVDVSSFGFFDVYKYIQLDKKVSHYRLLEFHPLTGPVSLLPTARRMRSLSAKGYLTICQGSSLRRKFCSLGSRSRSLLPFVQHQVWLVVWEGVILSSSWVSDSGRTSHLYHGLPAASMCQQRMVRSVAAS